MTTTTRLCKTLAVCIVPAAAAICLATVAPAVRAQTEAQNRDGYVVPVKDWDVYVDLPTRFAFVKTPQRWVFVRQLDEAQMDRLPPSTLTALLLVDDGETRYAHPALEPSPRARHQAETRQTRIAATGATPRP